MGFQLQNPAGGATATQKTLISKIGPQASAQPTTKIAGANPAQTVGNLRLTELTTITKGESAGFGMPNWNTGPGGGQNLLAFGHLWKLASGLLLTVYSRETGEASTDGNGSICYKTSSDYGATWSAETLVYLASSNPAFPAMSDLTCWQNSRGRIFIWFNIQSVAGQLPGQLIYTDDPLATPGTWSSPITVVDSNFSFNYFAVVCNAIELASGTMLLPGYGLNTGDPQKSCVCLQSTDNGLTWTRRSLMTNGPVLGTEYVEPCFIFRADESILVSMRKNINSTINFITSSDQGLTWSAVGANTVPGQGKPYMLRITNGTIILTTRSAATGGASCLFVCRDGDGTLATSWGPEEDFDPRVSAAGVPYRSYYAGLAEIAPNVIGCAFGGANGVSTQSDWCYTCFVDGNAIVPTGSAVHRDIFCNGLAANRQSVVTIPNGINHIGNSATGTQIATAMNALIDLMTTSGIGFQHPETPGNLIGWYEPCRDPGQVVGTGAANLLDLSLAGVGNLTQSTGAKKPLYEIISWLGRDNGMLFANGVQSMASSAFTGKSPPFTIWIFAFLSG